jgi:pyruvate dehydrogenase E1 component alpha subunit
VLFRDRAVGAGVLSDEDVEAIEKDVNDIIDDAVAFADASPEPPAEELFTDIYKD